MVDGVSTFFRRVSGDGPPAVFVHGVPNHSEDWQPFLERMTGRRWPSTSPASGALGAAVAGGVRLLDGWPWRGSRAASCSGWPSSDHSLVVHDWGAVGLIGAQEEPERVRRLVIINAVVLLPGYRWHRTARIWRTRGLGELSHPLPSRRLLDLGLRESRGDWSRHDPAFVDMIWDHLDTAAPSRRSCGSTAPRDPDASPHAGRAPGSDHGAGAGRLGGARPLPSRALRARLRGRAAEFGADRAPGAGHWPWIDAPEVVDRVIRFLTSDEEFRHAYESVAITRG